MFWMLERGISFKGFAVIGGVRQGGAQETPLRSDWAGRHGTRPRRLLIPRVLTERYLVDNKMKHPAALYFIAERKREEKRGGNLFSAVCWAKPCSFSL